eukprot:118838-Lingulodinium_polyedra.AAC.1
MQRCDAGACASARCEDIREGSRQVVARRCSLRDWQWRSKRGALLAMRSRTRRIISPPGLYCLSCSQ